MSEDATKGSTDIQEAVARERLVRTVAFHPVREHVSGFELMPMTLRHYSMLSLAGSPFLPPFTTPDPDDMFLFAWILSPQFSVEGGKPKRSLYKRFEDFYAPPQPLIKTRSALARWGLKTAIAVGRQVEFTVRARAFVEETMMDRPQGSNSMIGGPDYYCDEASICAMIAREYGWSDEEILGKPLKRIFQYLNEIRESFYLRNGKTPVMFNPSDKIVDLDLERRNRELMEQGLIGKAKP